MRVKERTEALESMTGPIAGDNQMNEQVVLYQEGKCV